jgi:hypothetical protein
MPETMIPKIVELARENAPLSDVQAAVGKLWLDYGGAAQDADGAVSRAIEAHWRARGGEDPYWDFLATRGVCDACGESYKHENLSICPNCFRTYCPRHGRACRCGHAALG